MRALVVVAIAALSIACQAQAGVTLDQQSVPQSGIVAMTSAAGSQVELFNPIGQTFTVGLTGTLSRIDVGVFQFSVDQSTADAQFSLLSSSGGTQTVLFSTAIPLSDIPVLALGVSTWGQAPSVDLSAANIQVQAGEQLEFRFTPVTGGSQWPTLLSYVDGQSLTYSGGTGTAVVGGTRFDLPNLDYAFRTYVDVPEPATWALMLLGFGATGSMLRRRRPVAT